MIPPVPHTTSFQEKQGSKITQPWIQWLELVRREINTQGATGAISHADLIGVTEDQHHPKNHTHVSDPISHTNLMNVTENQHHVKAHKHNGIDGSDFVDYFGPVVSATEFSLPPYNGLSGRLSRSDHQHGTPASAGSKELFGFRQIAGGTWGDRWYGAGEVLNDAATFATTLDTLYTVPLLMGKNTKISGLGLRHNVSAIRSYHIGLYTNTSDSYLYPNALIVDSGQITTAATPAWFEVAVSVTQLIDTLIWAVMLVSASGGNVYGFNGTSSRNFLGRSVAGITGTAGPMISVAQTYGNLPATYPAGAVISTAGTFPGIYVRFSA